MRNASWAVSFEWTVLDGLDLGRKSLGWLGKAWIIVLDGKVYISYSLPYIHTQYGL